jgi:hypothetical protein
MVTGYTSAATISDSTGSIIPISGNFVNGVLSQSVSVCTAITNDVITISNVDAIITSTSFSVTPGPIDSIALSPITSPQIAGSPFTFTATAQDACGNTITGFNQGAALSDTTGTLSLTTATFSGGYLTATAEVFKAYLGNVITITSQGKTVISNPFTVEAGGPDHFFSQSIGPQQAGMPFTVTFTARDLYDNFVSSFSGAAVSQIHLLRYPRIRGVSQEGISLKQLQFAKPPHWIL